MLVILLMLQIAAPQDANPDFGPFFQGLMSPRTGGKCCGMADCRTVDYRKTVEGFEVFIDRKRFSDGPDRWVAVPRASVLPPRPNPTGKAIACWTAMSGVLCFLQENPSV